MLNGRVKKEKLESVEKFLKEKKRGEKDRENPI